MGKSDNVSVMVRVDREIEDLVKQLSIKWGYARFTVRNLALLIGLNVLTKQGLELNNKEALKVVEKLMKEVGLNEEDMGKAG